MTWLVGGAGGRRFGLRWRGLLGVRGEGDWFEMAWIVGGVGRRRFWFEMKYVGVRGCTWF
jgi:hypothetical protein